MPPSGADEFRVAGGYSHEVVLRWGDDLGNGTFGYDPDFTAYFPIDLLDRGFDLARPHAGFARTDASSSEGLLVVNHEHVDSRLATGDLRREVGVSVSRIARKSGRWQLQKDARLNRRYDARTAFLLTGPAAKVDGGPYVVGTLANCSGGVTPWGTVLSCEENFQDFIGTEQEPGERPPLNWDKSVYGKRHYGWVVEIDPYDPAATPRKHTAMGRFRHENVGIRVSRDGTVVAYMGDDKRDSCVFKFIADKKLGNDRAANLSILESGRLYAADFGNGRWIPLPMTAEALCDAKEAALKARATPVDRPEDLDVHPIDGSVFIALTNNSLHGNFYGQIVRLVEKNDDPASTEFEWSVFATGGPQSGFACPDNLLFDDEGNLWMCTDVSDEKVGRGIYSSFGNNSMFLLPRDYDGGKVYRFATGPVEAELTGPSWTPDGSTLFLSVQHPGGATGASHWPDGGPTIARGAVVAITGFA